MYLYEKKDNKINVYELNPKEKLIEDYKRSEIRKIPNTERVYSAKSNLSRQELPLYNIDEINGIVYLKDLQFENTWLFFREFHEVKKYKDLDLAETVLENYYKNDKRPNDNNCMVISGSNNEYRNYYILTQYYSENYPFIGSSKEVMDGIINVPSSLFILDNIQLGNGSRIKDFKISEQAELFNFSKEPIESFSFDDINKLEKFEIVRQQLSNIDLENNKQLIKKLIKK